MNDPTTFHNRLKIECVTPSKFRVIDRIDGTTKFESCHRKEREGRNPRTGETIQIPASIQPKFSAGKGLKDALN